jgi:TatD DNase family protein
MHDTHLHLDLIEDNEILLEELKNNSIFVVFVTNLPNLFVKAKQIQFSPNINLALGFHPELVFEYRHLIPRMWELVDKSRFIGEIGLDFSKNTTEKSIELQKKFFSELMSRCANKNKIFTIHSRNAEKELIKLIPLKSNSRFIMHYFSGSTNELDSYINRGCFFSINHKMTNTKKGKSIIQKIPIDKILLESDAPFTYKNGDISNYINSIKATLNMVAKIKNQTSKDMELQLNENLRNLLNNT